MSEGNGKIREVDSCGIESYKFGRGEDFVIAKIDVVGVSDLWSAERAKYCDETGNVTKDHAPHINAVALKFTQGVVANCGEPKEKAAVVAAALSAGEALRFLKLLSDDVDAILPLLAPASAIKRSSSEPIEPIYA